MRLYGLFIIFVGIAGFVDLVFFTEAVQPFGTFACGCLIGTGIGQVMSD